MTRAGGQCKEQQIFPGIAKPHQSSAVILLGFGIHLSIQIILMNHLLCVRSWTYEPGRKGVRV